MHSVLASLSLRTIRVCRAALHGVRMMRYLLQGERPNRAAEGPLALQEHVQGWSTCWVAHLQLSRLCLAPQAQCPAHQVRPPHPVAAPIAACLVSRYSPENPLK